jgi:hypothetical protein
MPNSCFARLRTIGAMVATLLLAAACGGGDTTVAGVGSGGTGFVGGKVTKGPVGSATVTAFGITGGQVGSQVGTATTDAGGNFSMSIGTYAGPLMLQVSGGSYTDEATGGPMSMAPGDVMTLALPTVGAGATTSGVQVTPITAMAQALAQHMAGGMTDANITAANTAMGSYFTITDIVHGQPMNPLVTGSGAGASVDAQNYGMTLAAMSKYAQSLGLGFSSAMVTAMMSDAADGMMDGKAGSATVQMGGMAGGMMMPSTAGTSGLGASMNAFMNSTQNKSGVTTPALMNKLMGASGQILGTGPGMTSTTVSGTVFNGPTSKATVTALAVSNGMPGAQIASTTADGQGNFSMTLGNYSGPVMLQMTGGVYTDEATGTVMAMGASDVMSAAIPMVTQGANVTGVWVTPMTSMAQARATGMSGGMSDANIAAANTAMGNYFLVGDILHTQPMNPMLPGSATGASQDARNCGMTLAAMSQYAKGLTMTVSSAMVTAMMGDAVDGLMDGKKGGSPIAMPMGGMMGSSMMASTAGTSGLGAAMTDFMNSAANASGMTATDMAALIQKLTNSDGRL